MTLEQPEERGGSSLPALAFLARGGRIPGILARYSVLFAMTLTVVVIGFLRTDTFLTTGNLQVILIQASPLAVIALGLTAVLVMGDFDLSFGAVASLAGAIVISLMSRGGVHWLAALACALAAGAAIGAANGAFTAFFGAPAFIVTLAVSTALTGIEFLITDQRSIYTGIAGSYSNISQGSLIGINNQILIAGIVFVLVSALLQQSELGRRMYAVGGSQEAARLAGIRVVRLRVIGFVLAATLAAVAGIMISSDSGAYTPSAGAGFLLPAFAAVFLGSTLRNRGMFTAYGTLVGVLFLGIIENGLILLGIAVAWVNITQGAILLGAILTARLGQR